MRPRAGRPSAAATAGLERDAGHRRRDQPITVEATHDAKPLAATRVPFLAECHDLIVGAADEVPPHHQLLGERLTTEEERPPVPGNLDAVATRSEVGEFARPERQPLDR